MHGYATDEEEEGLPEPAEITLQRLHSLIRRLQRVHSLIRQAHEQGLGPSRTQEVWNLPLLQAERQPTEEAAEAASWQSLPAQSMPQAFPIRRERILQSAVPIQLRPAVVPVQVNMQQIAGMQAAPQANSMQTALCKCPRGATGPGQQF